ncbi:MAG: hypothetical protein ACR2NA_09730 [Solirubrobacterales bacterium]
MSTDPARPSPAQPSPDLQADIRRRTEERLSRIVDTASTAAGKIEEGAREDAEGYLLEVRLWADENAGNDKARIEAAASAAEAAVADTMAHGDRYALELTDAIGAVRAAVQQAQAAGEVGDRSLDAEGRPPFVVAQPDVASPDPADG